MAVGPSKQGMGEPLTARIDTAALGATANRFDDTADLIEQAGRIRLVFGGSAAGRAHGLHGDELRRSLEVLLADLNVWARAAAEIAVELRAVADRYRGADMSAAAGIG